MTPREGDIDAASSIHPVMHGGNHGQNQFSGTPPSFQDNAFTPPSYTSQLSSSPSPNPQMSPANFLGSYPHAATPVGNLPTPPLLPVGTPIPSGDMKCMPQDSQSMCSVIPSYPWGLENDSENFFQFPHDQHNPTITASMDLLDLNASLASLPTSVSQSVDNRTTLHLAAEHNRINIVQLLLVRNADVRAQDRWGYTALHIAAMRGYDELTRLLLSSTCSCSSTSTSSSLSTASSPPSATTSDSVPQLSEFIEVPDAGGYTALHHAAENGHVGVVEILFGAGANPRARNGTGATPLHLAASRGHEAVAVCLVMAATTISTPCAVDALTPGSSTHSASSHSKSNDSNGNSSGNNSSNKSSASVSPTRSNFSQSLNPPSTASGSPSSNESCTNSVWSPALLQVQTPPESLHDLPHIRDNYGATPFHAAAESGLSPSIINILLSAGAVLDVLDTSTGFSPLHYAAQKGHESIVRILLDNGASVGMKATCGWTALHLAVQGGHDGVVSALLERGAEVDARTEMWRM